MSDALSTIGSAAVSTIGTVAVVNTTAKVVGKAIGGGGPRKSKNYNVWSSTKKSGSHRKSKSMLGY